MLVIVIVNVNVHVHVLVHVHVTVIVHVNVNVMNVCVCMCVCAWMHVHVCVNVCVCVHACKSALVFATCVRVSMHECMLYVCAHASCVFSYVRACIPTYEHALVYRGTTPAG